MKKKILLFVVLFTLVLGFNVKADTYTPENVPDISYIIGTHLFTRRPAQGSPYQRRLTTEWIMLASKTISGDTYESLNDRIIYYKASEPDENGHQWFNAITDEPVTPPRSFNIEYKDGVKIIGSPMAYLDWNEESDPAGYNKYLINNEGLLYANIKIQTNDNNIDGYEVYDINNQAVVSGPVTGPLSVIGPISITKPETVPATYYVKVYKTYNEIKMFSSPSPTFVLDFNMVMPVLNLSQIENNVLYRYNTQTKKLETNLKATLPSGAEGAIIDGYDIFKVNENGEDSFVVSAKKGEDVIVSADLKDQASYYAKAFRGSGENKVYGAKSNVLDLTFRNAVPPVPSKFVQKPVQENDTTGYSDYFVENGKLSTRVAITLPENTTADGYDVFIGNEKINTNDVTSDGIITITGTYNTGQTLYAKTYYKYGSSEDYIKDYSDNSTPLNLDFKLTLPTPTLVQDTYGIDDKFTYNSETDLLETNVHIEFPENTYTNNIDKYEIIEQLPPNTIVGGLTDHVTVSGSLGAEKRFTVKVYKEIDGNKVYSSTSELTITFSNGTPLTPVLNQIKTNNEDYYYDETNGKMATKVNITVETGTMNGYDIFVKDNEDPVYSNNALTDTVIVYGDFNTSKTYYAKTYRLYGTKKHYSEKSNELTFDFKNGVTYMPELSLKWDNNIYNKYHVDSEGNLFADVSINATGNENIDGYDVFDEQDNLVKSGLPTAIVSLPGSVNVPTTYYAKAYRLYGTSKDYGPASNDLTILYDFVLPTPTLVQDTYESNEKYIYNPEKDWVETNVHITLPDEAVLDNIDGYVVSNTLKPSDIVLGVINESVTLHGDLAQIKRLNVKVYKTIGGVKVYGAVSTPSLELQFKNDSPTAPVLSTVWNSDLEPDGYTKYHFDNSGNIVADVKINATINDKIDGYDIFDSNDSNTAIVSGRPTETVAVPGVANETKVYYAKAYRLYGDKKDYSNESNTIELDYIMKFPTPTLINSYWDSENDPNGYDKYYYDEDEKSLATKVSITVPDAALNGPFNGYVVVKENGEEVAVSTSLENEVVIYGKFDVEENYYAKVYRLNGQDKVSGNLSNKLTFNFKNNFPNASLRFEKTNEPYKYRVILNSEELSKADIDGVEFYYRDDNATIGNLISPTGGYQLLDLDFFDSNATKPLDDRLYYIPNEVYTIKARPYKNYVEGSNQVTNYGSYSREEQVDTIIPVPQFDPLLETIMCENSICSIDVYNLLTNDIYFLGDNQPPYYYNYIDLFEVGNNNPVLEAIPTNDYKKLTGIPKGSNKTYYAQAYVMYKGEKLYSEKSDPVDVKFLFDPEVPALIAEHVIDAPYSYKITIDNDFNYYLDDEMTHPIIEGIEFYTKNGDNYEVINLPYFSSNGLTDARLYNVPNRVTTIYARAYQNTINGKIYTDYSEGVEVGYLVPIPDFAVDLSSMDCIDGSCYVDFRCDSDDFVYFNDPEDPSQDVYYFENIDVFDASDDSLVATVPIGSVGTLEVGAPKGSTKNYYARAYVEYNNEKVYGSKTGNEEVVFLFTLDKPILDVEDGLTPYNFRVALANKDSYKTSSNNLKIDGIEFYVKDGNNYNKIDLSYVNGGNTPIDDHLYGIPNTKTEIYARVYQLDSDNTPLYSDYSDTGASVGRLIPEMAPYSIEAGGSGDLVCQNRICSMIFYSSSEGATYKPGIYYYDYVDLFDKETNQLVLEAIPTGSNKTLEGVPKGSIKSYYARPYVMVGGQKVYGSTNYNLESEVEYLYDPSTPYIEASKIEGDGETPYNFLIQILNQDDYSMGDDNDIIIDGIDFFIKDENEEYHLIDLPLYDENDTSIFADRVYDVPNQPIRVYAAVYQYLTNNEKRYGLYTEEPFDVGEYIPIPPDIELDTDSISCIGATCSIDVHELTNPDDVLYKADDDESNNIYYYEYVDIFEVGVDTPVLVDLPIGESGTISNVLMGTTKSYYAKAYVLYTPSSGGTPIKAYSDPTEVQQVVVMPQ